MSERDMHAEAEQTVHYINTDLLLEASVDLAELARGLTLHPLLSCLHAGQVEAGYQAHFEAFGPDGTHEAPEQSITALLDAVEQLPHGLQPVWRACSRKTLDVGYNSGVTPRHVSHTISTGTLLRMQSLGIDLCITVYALGD